MLSRSAEDSCRNDSCRNNSCRNNSCRDDVFRRRCFSAPMFFGADVFRRRCFSAPMFFGADVFRRRILGHGSAAGARLGSGSAASSGSTVEQRERGSAAGARRAAGARSSSGSAGEQRERGSVIRSVAPVFHLSGGASSSGFWDRLEHSEVNFLPRHVYRSLPSASSFMP